MNYTKHLVFYQVVFQVLLYLKMVLNKSDKYVLTTRSSQFPPRIVAMTNNSDTTNGTSPLKLNFTSLSFGNVCIV